MQLLILFFKSCIYNLNSSKKTDMQRKNYVKKEYCRPELSVISVSTEPIMGTNSPFKSDHKKADDDNTNTFDVDPD